MAALRPDPTQTKLRERLLDELRQAGIRNDKVLDAMGKVARELFVAPALTKEAYDNKALPIGEGQTISQPLIVALMTHALDVQPDHKVLEIGTGSGYQTAILCKLVRRVFTVERFDSLTRSADRRLHSLGISNFIARTADGTQGWPEQAPFDRILVTAASPTPPKSLLDQLAPGGLLVIPIGPPDGDQQLMRYWRRPDGTISPENLGGVRFVPLVGKEGVPAGVKKGA